MADHILSLPGGLTLCFRTSCALGVRERLSLGAHLPGVSLLDAAAGSADVTVEHIVSDKPFLEDDGARIAIGTKAGEKLPEDLYHLLYRAQRRALMGRGLYCVHSACVGTEDGYTLIVGHSGAGKTTLAQKLVDRHGLQLFSGNKTVVRFGGDGGIAAIAGTRTMTALDQDLKRFAYEMQPDEYASQAEVKITSIVLARVNDGVEEAETLNPLSALHTLYPYFMDAVNADAIVNGRDVFDGDPGPGAKRALAEGLEKAVKMIPVHKFSGSMNFLQRKVLQP